MLEAVAAEAAKVVTAEVVGVLFKGGKRLVRAVRDRVGGQPDREQLERALLAGMREDSAWAAQISALVAQTAEARDPLVVPAPPDPFFDRDEARAFAPRTGVFVISGRRGSGRIALAEKIAAERADEFPFGAIEIDLDHWRAGQALAFSQLKDFLLARLGIPAAEIATDPRVLDQQLSSALLTRRLLLILLNARGVKEIAPFAVGSGANLVIVTTGQLTDEIRMAYPRHVLLGRLEGRGGWDLLASRCGAATLLAEPQATERLLDICDHMPQAITYAAVALQRRRGRPHAVADLVAHLDVVGVGADEVILGTLQETFEALPADVLAGCALLASHPGPDFTEKSAAALVGAPVTALLDQLTDAGMLSAAGAGRIRLHHAVRKYVASLEIPGIDFDAGFSRVLEYYCDRAVAADLADDPDRLRRYRHRDVAPDAAALASLDQDRAVLLDVVREAVQRGFHHQACQLSGALEVLVNKKGGYHWYAAMNEYVLTSADALAHGATELAGRVHMMQARMYTLMNVFDRATIELDAAWPLVRASAADQQLLSSCLEFSARLAEERTKALGGTDFAEAVTLFNQAIEIDSAIQDGRAYGIHVRMLANVLIEAGHHIDARTALERAIAVTKPGRNLARLHMVLARADMGLGNLPAARAALDSAKAILAADGATQYNWELEEREAEFALAAKRFGEAKDRLLRLTEAAFNTGHPRAYRYLRELERLNPPGRR